MPRVILACLVVFFGEAGCGHVSPWEREDLARMERSSVRHSTSAGYEAHLWMVREGVVGGTGEPGGGCGCN